MSKKILDLLKKLHKEGIKVKLDKGSLSIKSKQERIEPILIEEIKKHKQDIISYLEKHQNPVQKKGSLLESAITPFDRTVINKFPLSFSQERLWFIDKLEGSIAYHIPVVLQLQGDLDIIVLKSSLKEVLSRHEVLRTVIQSEEGKGSQELLSPDNWSMDVIKMTSSSILDEELKNFIDQPFDLSKDYMMRASLYELSKDEHILTVVFHHISSDGWSDAILINEFVELYTAQKEKRSPALNDLPLQYIDYALWQRKYIQGEILDGELAYWKNQLSGISPLLLPTDYPRPLIKSKSGSGFLYELDIELTDRISKLCKEQQVTSFMMLLSAFKIILSRYSHQEDICVGTPIANRTQAELEELIGFFVNSLALRTTIDCELDFNDLLQEVKKTTLEAYDHQLVPFEKVVDQVVDSRDMSTTPLFQVMFVLQNIHSETEIKLDGLTLSNYEQNNTTAKFDLTFTIEETESGFSLYVEYCTDLFKKETIQRMVIHYEELLKNIVRNPKAKIGNLSMITETEKEEQLNLLSTTSIDYPSDQTIVSLFENQALKNPDAVAVVFENEKLTYKELDEKSNQLANCLVANGVQKEELVPICMERSLDMIIGLIAIMKAGGAYVPLDPSIPKSRVDFILEDTQAKIILIQSSQISLLEDKNSIKPILLDKLSYNDYKRTNTGIIIHPEYLIYVIYTSGTTGKPKGVLLEHRNVVRLFFNEKGLFDFNDQDVWSMFHSFSFDFSVWEMYGALLYGGKLVIVPKSHTRDMVLFSKFVEKEGITVLNQTPSAFKVFQEEALKEKIKSSVRYLIFGGEALSPSMLKEWNSIYPDCKIINMYGITETTVHVTYKEITIQEIEANISNIGTAIPTLGCVVLNEGKQIVPKGVAGELYVLGAGVARGYLNRPELTEERFTPLNIDNLNTIPCYRSGDLVRRLVTGELEYLGRIDTQVKIRGYRIELGEIEAQIEKLAVVKQSVVLAKADKNGNKRLVAYIVFEEEIDSAEIIEELKGKLPEYMVPQLYVSLESFPLTSNGKVNRKSLPEPPENAFVRNEYIAPENEKQGILVEIWKNHLDLDTIGITDDYFRVGGDSITMIRLMSEVNKKFKIDIKIAQFYANPTIKGLSKLLGTCGLSESKNKLIVEIEKTLEELQEQVKNIHPNPQSIASVYPMSDIQKGMLITSQNGVESGDFGIYHDQFADQVPLVDVQLMQRSLDLLAAKHETLRTGFDFYNFTEPVQIIYKEVNNSIGYDDISYKNTSEKEIYIEKFLKTERELHPFQIDKAPLWRINIFKVSDSEMVFVIQFHHAILDGWSEKTLKVELFNLYEKLKEDSSYTPPKLQCGMRDSMISDMVEQNDVENKKYWKQELEDYRILDIFTEASKVEMQTRNYEDDFKDKLLTKCEKDNVSPKALFFGAYVYVLSMLSGEKDMIVGMVTNRRPMVNDGEKLLGCFLNTIPFRFDLTSRILSWTEYIKQIDQKLKDLKGKDRLSLIGISKLTDEIHYNNPYFDILFNFVDFHVFNQIKDKTLLDHEANEKLNIEDDFERTNTFLDFNVSLTFNRLQVGITQARELKSGHSIDDVYKYIDQFLNCYLDETNQVFDSTYLLQEIEKGQLLKSFNATSFPYPKNKTLVELFTEKVKDSPESLALVSEGTRITYKELDEESNRLAHYLLLNNSLEIENLVSVKLPRSEWLVISFLAIIKSGAAYVPIDPNYPEERIHYIEKDSNCAVAINEGLLKEFRENRENYDITLPKVNITATNLAYVIYTSGSTGKPKGVMIEHQGIANTILSQLDNFGISVTDNCLQFSNQSFDASIWEILLSLLGGATLFVISEDTKSEVKRFEQYIEEHKISFATIPPAYLKLVDCSQIKNVKTLITAGEQAPLEKAKSFSEYGTYVNAYGPTETSICATTYKGNITSSVPIGIPISNTSVYILGSAHELLPLGVIGELCVSGTGLARGYLNKEDLTNEKFVPNPFVNGERMYKTGDLAKWLPDGNVEYVGRKDDQVKIRGYRIELGEIESVLQEQPEIDQSVVLASKDINANNRLVGYVVCKDVFDKTHIQDQLQLRLPDYMIPKLWIELDALPVTPNGKLDKKALPEVNDIVLSKENYIAPQNAIEENLCEIWRDLLGIEKIGVSDNFFELGGDSILTIQVIGRARRLGYSVQSKDVFKYQTIAELSSFIRTRTKSVIGEQGKLTGRSDLLPIQQWYLDTSYSRNIHFNQSMLLLVDKSVEEEFIVGATNLLIEHHDALRFEYYKENDVWYQIYGRGNGKVYIEDISTKTIEEIPDALAEICQSYQHSISIEKGEVFKMVLIKTPESEEKNRLFMVAHHMVIDGVSWRILLNDLDHIIPSLINHKKVQLGEKTSSYRQWSKHLREYTTNKAFFTQKSYWDTIISFYKALPVDKEFIGEKNGRDVNNYAITLDEVLTETLLKEVNQTYGTEINDILLSCLAMTISNWSGYDKIVIGLEGHGRENISKDIDVANTIGWFTNLYPVSLPAIPGEPLENVIKSVKEELRNIPDKGIGYGALKYLHPEDEVRNALSGDHWDIIFNYLGQFDNIVDQDSWFMMSSENVGNDVGDQMEFDNKLEVNGSIQSGKLILGWSYSALEYNPTTIETLADNYLSNLKKIILHCKTKEERVVTPSDYGLGKEIGYEELDLFAKASKEAELEGDDILEF
ncbi:non-ribosomal peptide synthetase [Aquimarina sp. Aq78]|uniref:non-ribosomal peptide synthetase n=1 Tax=Aquimarina sp. Aq78 TaxID=1191889 RepID=UPI000D0F87DB|nr:non-ribosomal peptide synthetase [Aquimarina sp. Aq78]